MLIKDVHAEIPSFAESTRGAQEDYPYEKIDGQLFGSSKGEVGAVAHDDVDKGDARHQGKEDGSKDLFKALVEKIEYHGIPKHGEAGNNRPASMVRLSDGFHIGFCS